MKLAIFPSTRFPLHFIVLHGHGYFVKLYLKTRVANLSFEAIRKGLIGFLVGLEP